ncbi:kinase-like domain-containing protein [Halenospora varia]|nr:kinase-like domain-containing protein [Halenospora varia]
MASIYPRYIPSDPREGSDSTVASSIRVLRPSDNTFFLASIIPDVCTKDIPNPTYTTKLAPVILPTAGKSLSLILNHPNIISLIDIIQPSLLPGSHTTLNNKKPAPTADLTIFEDMNAGSLAYLLPSANSYPNPSDTHSWHVLATPNPARFSLPESLCWHVLRSISKALLWLHHGVKETAGIPGEYMKHDDDWHPILVMDISPGQIWFKRPEGGETYGECKLGGFQWARVIGTVGGEVAVASRVEGAQMVKKWFWAPEVYTNLSPWTRSSETFSLGATIYAMMTGIPPPRLYNYDWQISRMNDKGFSKGIRDIVADMLKHDPRERPDGVSLVNRVEGGWRTWRAETREGRMFVDVDDKVMERGVVGRVGTLDGL